MEGKTKSTELDEALEALIAHEEAEKIGRRYDFSRFLRQWQKNGWSKNWSESE